MKKGIGFFLITLRLFIFLLVPLNVFTQNTNDYFNFSKNAFYYGQMAEWKDLIYETDAEFEIKIDNDSLYAFSAKNILFHEIFYLNLDKDQNINKIERFLIARNGNLDDYFPFKYPININKIFKTTGEPDYTAENKKYKSKYISPESEYIFQKYYKWNNLLYKDNRVSMVIANLKVSIPKKIIEEKSRNIKPLIVVIFHTQRKDN